jgi:acyl-CoA synthetase (AMP-forming)/AMP-acid ligase II
MLLEDEDWHVFVYLALDFLHAAYVPFGRNCPVSQVQSARETLTLSSILIDDSFATEYGIEEKCRLKLTNEHLKAPLLSPDHYTESTYTSYILCSSGSTGAKKWIPIESNGIIHWADILRQYFTTARHVLSTIEPDYDARIFEYLIAFASGGCVYLLDALSRKELKAIIHSCKKYSITSLLLIASRLNNNRTDNLLCELKKHNLSDLMVTGDACSVQLVLLCERYGIDLWNCYGPTEATFGMSMLRVNGLVNAHNPVPIGQPILPVKAHIIDNEMYIESPFLSKGYLGATEEVNTDAFQTRLIDGKPTRLFWTGDRFHVLDNGFFAFDGRSNEESHAKVNGVKITPFAIEQCLNNYQPEALHAVVVIKPWLGKEKPVAYIVLNQTIEKQALIDYLKKNLKKEEFPLVIELNTFPLLVPSQKIDKQTLIKRQDDPESLYFKLNHNAVIEPVNPLLHEYQQQLTALWSSLFNLDTVDPDQDFMLLGGDSLLATELTMQIQSTICTSFRYRDLLMLPIVTIKTISEHLLAEAKQDQDQVLIKKIFDYNDEAPLFLLPPLLGEGYFTYRHLALQIGTQLKYTIYGLTDPGVFDENKLPDSLDQAADRYIQAIFNIQPPSQGNTPYNLGGFSFGCTLAGIVAEKLVDMGEKIDTLHLLDGFPPLFYQQLKKQGHAYLLRSMARFIIQTLNNKYYNQGITPTNYKGLDEVTPLQQIKVVFDNLLSELNPNLPSYTEANCVLLIARRHLSLMRTAMVPEVKSNLYPVLYLTDTTQPYLEVIASIDTLSKRSCSHQFYFWNHYYHNLRRNGVNLAVQHGELLLKKEGQVAKSYFQFAHDKMFNMSFYEPFYFNTSYILSDNECEVYFLSPYLQQYYKRVLDELGLHYQITVLHKNTHSAYSKVLSEQALSAQIFLATTSAPRIYQEDMLYSGLLCVRITFSREQQDKIQTFLNTIPNKNRMTESDENLLGVTFTPGTVPLTMQFNFMQHYETTLCTVDLQVYVNNIPDIPKEHGFCVKSPNRNALYFIHHADPNLYESKPILVEAQTWLFHVIRSLKNCFSPKITTHGFFNNPERHCLIKTYQLEDHSQTSFEKGLRKAVVNNRIEDVKKFLTVVDNINAQDPNPDTKRTALHWAAIKGHQECYTLLRAHGAEDDVFDAQKKMPADYLLEALETRLFPSRK